MNKTSEVKDVTHLPPVSTLECSETVQVRVRPVPAYCGAVRLAEMATLGWGTVERGGRTSILSSIHSPVGLQTVL